MDLLDFNDPAIQGQAVAAGYSDVNLYIRSLLERDADRLAVQQGIESMKAGRVRPFDEFDRDFRARNGLPPRA
jgi:hypothetical protein